MPNKNYIRGYKAEILAMAMLEEQGYECCRAAGSHGRFDLIAWNTEHIRFIQIKSEKIPTNNTYSAERKRMAESKLPPHGRMELWVWGDRISWRFIAVITGEKSYDVLHQQFIEGGKRGRKPLSPSKKKTGPQIDKKKKERLSGNVSA
jgi:Holliday junction resolvase